MPLHPFLTASSAKPLVYSICPISLRVFLHEQFQNQGHLWCWYLSFTEEQTRYLQEKVTEIFTVPVSAKVKVFLTDLRIQDFFQPYSGRMKALSERLSFSLFREHLGQNRGLNSSVSSVLGSPSCVMQHRGFDSPLSLR